MTNRILRSLLLFATLFLFTSSSWGLETYYANNFESGIIPNAHPVPQEAGQLWTLSTDILKTYGPGNHFIISDTSSHNGNFSLRFNYEGRNGLCNICGANEFKHIQLGHDGVDYFIADNGQDLSVVKGSQPETDNDGARAEPGKYVYDIDKGFSRWKILSLASENSPNDRLNLQLAQPGINGETTIVGGDAILITRQCGVDGTIGLKDGVNDISRRRDCNSVILWFGNITPQLPGKSIFRRQYLKAEVTSPAVRQKLHYLRPERDDKNFRGEVVLFGQTSSEDIIEPELSGLGAFGAEKQIYKPATATEFEGLEFKRGIWYYVEEQYKAATLNLAYDATIDPNAFPDNPNIQKYNADGEYRLWFSESGHEPTQGSPTLEVTGIRLPPITGGDGTHISLWGNTQHHTHNRGSWYIDDIQISNAFNGSIPQNGKNVFPPLSPEVSAN